MMLRLINVVIDTLIFSGGSLPVGKIDESCSKVIHDVCKEKLRSVFPIDEILSSYRIVMRSSPQLSDKRKILVRFSNIQTRNSILANCKSNKPENIYVNELNVRQMEKLPLLGHATVRFMLGLKQLILTLEEL